MLTQDRDWEAYWRLLFKKVKDSGDFFMAVTINQQTFIDCLEDLVFCVNFVGIKIFEFGLEI